MMRKPICGGSAPCVTQQRMGSEKSGLDTPTYRGDILPRMEALPLVVVVGAVLYGLWLLLHFTFDSIDQWHARARVSAKDSSANMERETSESH